MPFLEVLTRCYRRPVLLAHNQASLDAQTDGDWVQTLLIDEVGRGIAWANQHLAAQAGALVGEYIWILDDDDRCIRPTLTAELKAIVAQHQPRVIMLRMDHGPLGVLPPDELWGRLPREGAIGVSAFVVQRAVWQRHASWLAGGPARVARYASDFDFIWHILAAECGTASAVYWHDVTASAVQRISHGAPEA